MAKTQGMKSWEANLIKMGHPTRAPTGINMRNSYVILARMKHHDNDMKNAVSDLFRASGKAHQQAYITTNGEDAEWPIWYANYLYEPLSRLLETTLTRSQLIYCLMDVEFEREVMDPDADLPTYYAEHFIERFATVGTKSMDKLALYHRPGCPYCILVRTTIDRLNIDVELRDISSEQQHLDDLVTVRKRATVPVLKISTPGVDSHWMKITFIWAAEYAHQIDSGDNTNNISADYLLGELGVKFGFAGPVSELVFKVDYELQEGNSGADRFLTILGTNHPYQGWADRFLITPVDGIQDIYLTAVLKAYGAKFVVVYHDFSSDKDSYNYGSEFDLLATKTFKKHYTYGLTYADYNANQNIMNTGATAADTKKFWAFFQFEY